MGLILICTKIPSHGAAGERGVEVDANDTVVRREVFTLPGWDEAPGDEDDPVPLAPTPFPRLRASRGAAGCGCSPVPLRPPQPPALSGLGEEDSSGWRFR